MPYPLLPAPFALLVVFFGLAGDGDAQVRFRTNNSGIAPSARSGACGAFDPVRGVFVMFGGHNQASFLNDTWEFDGVFWRRVFTPTRPPAMSGAAMAFSRRRGALILFGGSDGRPYDRTWLFDGRGWSQIFPSNPPPARALHGMAGGRQVGGPEVVLFGGRDANGQPLGDTWEWDGASWLQRPGNGPAPQEPTGMAAHRWHPEVVLLANQPGFEAWRYDVNGWQKLGTVGAAPQVRSGAHFVYDSARGRYVLFGGRSNQNGFLRDVFELEGNTWIGRTPNQAAAPRANGVAAFHENNRETLIFGGELAPGSFDGATLLYGPTTPAFVQTIGDACVNSTSVPSDLSLELPWRGYPSALNLTNIPNPGLAFLYIGAPAASWLNRSLPFDGGFYGMPGCTFAIAPLGGELFPVTATGLGSINTWTIPVPPSLGAVVTMQTFIVDPTVGNLAGAVTSNALFVVPGSK